MTGAVSRGERSSAGLDALLLALAERRPIDDELFDAVYSPRSQVLSSEHWTPIDAANLALSFLVRNPTDRVLDIGAGVGKLCIYGALVARQAHFVGIEHRMELVDEARDVAAALGVADRVELRHGPVATFDPRGFDAWYLFNPFGENLADEPIDRNVELGLERHARDIRRVERWLHGASVGTRVVTLHGFGGELPDTFDLHAELRVGRSELCAWDKRRDADGEPWR